MRKSVLEEAEAGIKVARKNINNLRYGEDKNLMAERKDEQKSLLKNFLQFFVIHTGTDYALA